jgi:ABC-type nickel/cobalt efflux system permease component RcnA
MRRSASHQLPWSLVVGFILLGSLGSFLFGQELAAYTQQTLNRALTSILLTGPTGSTLFPFPRTIVTGDVGNVPAIHHQPAPPQPVPTTTPQHIPAQAVASTAPSQATHEKQHDHQPGRQVHKQRTKGHRHAPGDSTDATHDEQGASKTKPLRT